MTNDTIVTAHACDDGEISLFLTDADGDVIHLRMPHADACALITILTRQVRASEGRFITYSRIPDSFDA